MRPKIKQVYFDAGGTLLRPHPSVGAVYSRVAERHGSKISPEDLDHSFRTVWKKRAGLVHEGEKLTPSDEKRWWHETVRRTFEPFGAPLNFGVFFEDLYYAFAEPECWMLYPETRAVLERLRTEGYRVSIISNWDSRLRTICEGLGIAQYFDHILVSAQVGAAKPHPEIFQAALKASAADPACSLHVGDSFEEDVLGARQAGLRALLLDRHATERHASAPDRIENLSQMFDHLGARHA